MFEPIPTRDTLLRSINFCPKFTAEVAAQPQRDAFSVGPEFESMMERVNRRLGFHGSNQLDFERIMIMWEWCRFETGSNVELSGSNIGDLSAWCAPFTVADHEVLEYREDLGYFHFTGYGVGNQRLIENLNCGLMQDLLMLIRTNELFDSTVRIFGSFSQILQSFLVTLGAVRDDNLLHQHNFAQQSSRQWKTSFITPNAANLAVIRYE